MLQASAQAVDFKVGSSFWRGTGVELPYTAIKTNIGDSVNVIVHLERRPGRRFVSEVLEINGYNPDTDLFHYCAVFQKEEAKP
jgi:hypothetical protein